MTSPKQNIPEEEAYIGSADTPKRSGRRTGRLIVLLAMIAGAAYFARSWTGDKPTTAQPTPRQPQAPAVALQTVVKADLAAKREYIGRVESMQTVLLKPQIAGEIAGVHFKEGSMIKAGQTLFTIDSTQYQATVTLRKAELAKAEANLSRAVKYLERLKAADKRSVSASDLDIAQSDVLQGKAGVEQAKASLRLAEIDLGHTKITAPISGRIGKAAYTKGNYVTPAGSTLANIVQTDPIRVAFALPDRDYLDMQEAFRGSDKSVYNATLRLSNGEPGPANGVRDFEENAMDERTGTIMIRLRFNNAEGILIPGSMVRVETKPIKSHIAVVVPQEALLMDAAGDYLYVVDANDVAHRQSVVPGIETGTMREIVSGLEGGERIVVRGLQSLRPDMKVKPMTATESNAQKSPAERAMESRSDVTALPSETASADRTAPDGKQEQPAKGKN